MHALIVALVALVIVAVIALSLSVKVVTQYQRGVLFRLGKVVGVKEPGLALIIPVIDRLVRVSLRIVTMPIQSQGIITRDNVSVDISAVAYFRVVDPVKSVIAIENVGAAINQIAQTTLRKVVGQHTLDDALSETDVINANIQKILDVATLEWGVEVNLVELKDIQLPDSMKRAMARQAEAEREKRAKIIAAEGESMAAAALGEASDTMMAHPLALQLRNLQTLAELGVEKNTTVVFPAPMMSAIGEISSFLTRETAAAQGITSPPPRQSIGTAARVVTTGARERRGSGTGVRRRLNAVRTAGLLGRVVSGAGAAHGFVDDLLSHVGQLAVFGLARRPQVGERVLDAAPGASPDEADRLIDHRARRQRLLQLDGQRERVGEDLRVVYSDRRWFREQFAEFGRVVIEDVFAVGVYVDRAYDLIWQQQRQRQRTVHT